MKMILSLITILFLFSCTKEDEQKSQSDTEPAVNETTVDIASLDVPILDAEVFRSLLDEHKGKILFINTWATWCVPCKEEFPDLIKLKDYYSESDVIFLGISVDLPDQIESAVKPFLISQNVNFPNYVQNFKDPADLINILNENWRGAVPATFIYDKEGIQQAFLLGRHSLEEFKTAIERVLHSK